MRSLNILKKIISNDIDIFASSKFEIQVKYNHQYYLIRKYKVIFKKYQTLENLCSHLRLQNNILLEFDKNIYIYVANSKNENLDGYNKNSITLELVSIDSFEYKNMNFLDNELFRFNNLNAALSSYFFKYMNIQLSNKIFISLKKFSNDQNSDDSKFGNIFFTNSTADINSILSTLPFGLSCKIQKISLKDIPRGVRTKINEKSIYYIIWLLFQQSLLPVRFVHQSISKDFYASYLLS
jgi:hypothetical protein